MIKRARFLLAGLALSGCVDTSSPQFAAKSDAMCKSYGVKPGTALYYDCRMRLLQMQQDDNRRRRKAFADGIGEVGENVQGNNAARRPVNCHSQPDYIGGWQTVCQ